MKQTNIKPGMYYLGDPCYCFPGDRSGNAWDEILENSEYFSKTSAEFKGHTVYALSTKHGDGCFKDQFDNEYGVDAGLIGLVPEALALQYQTHDELFGLSRLIRIDSDNSIMWESGGVLHFGIYNIDTDPEDEENEWDVEPEDDEDYDADFND